MINPYFNNKTIRPSFYSDYFKYTPRNKNLGRTKPETITSLGKQLKEYKLKKIKPINRLKPLEKVFQKQRLTRRI